MGGNHSIAEKQRGQINCADKVDLIERYKGSLLGLAVGEALGAPLYGKEPGSFKPIQDMIGGGPYGVSPGQWLDACAMALCITGSLLKEGFHPLGQIERYWKLYKKGYVTTKSKGVWKGLPFDPITREALKRFERSRNPFCCSSDLETFAGNGSLKRLAPVPLYYARWPREAILRSGESSSVTHGKLECVQACHYFSSLMVGAINGISKEDLLADRFELYEGIWEEFPLTGRISEIASGSFRLRKPPTIKGTPNAGDTLEAALWAFNISESFKDGTLSVVNLGEDSPSTGAVYGQLAGAYYGIGGIPLDWLWKVVKGESIEEQAEYLFNEARSIEMRP